MENVGKDATRELVKEIFEPFGVVEYIDYRTGETDGYVRMGSSELATAAIEGLTKEGKEIAGSKTTFSLLPGKNDKITI